MCVQAALVWRRNFIQRSLPQVLGLQGCHQLHVSGRPNVFGRLRGGDWLKSFCIQSCNGGLLYYLSSLFWNDNLDLHLFKVCLLFVSTSNQKQCIHLCSCLLCCQSALIARRLCFGHHPSQMSNDFLTSQACGFRRTPILKSRLLKLYERMSFAHMEKLRQALTCPVWNSFGEKCHWTG